MKVKVWSSVIICAFAFICMSGCQRNENTTINQDSNVAKQEQPCITSITQINDDEMEVAFSYELDGEIKTHSFISPSYPDLGLEPQDRAHVKLIDNDGDGISEVVCKVYYIGNTFTELCGDLYVYQVTKDGLEPVLSLVNVFIIKINLFAGVCI